MHDLDATVRILRATPASLDALLSGVPDALVHANYGPETFSAADVVGHLILGERLDWIPRTRVILEHGLDRPFDAFPWDGVDEATAGASITDRLSIFAELREQNLAELASMNLTPADLDRRGLHPKLGPVTLGQMLRTWGVHDLHHVAQICKAINYQFRDAIGPWRPHVNSIPS